ncbi:MAG: hypothetical protein ACE5JM_11985, partial [Armatimonadota bacterium]
AFTAFLLLLAAAAAPASAQTVSEVTLDASPQLFTVLCALRVAEQTPLTGSGDPRSAVAKVDRALAELDPDQAAPLRAFIQGGGHRSPADGLSAYISLALVLQSPPDFDFVLPQAQLPPDVLGLEEFPPLLRSFYAQADLERLWREVLPLYESVIAERQTDVARTLLETRAYLRLIGESALGGSYKVYLEWLVPPGLISARNYGVNYFLVIHPQRSDFLDAVRHQYLHFLLDPIAAKYADAMKAWVRLQPVAERAPRLPEAFRNDLLLLATESLIRAVEIRLGRLAPAAAAAELDESEGSGYVFTRHFFQALVLFEEEEPSIRYYFPELVQGLDVEQERARLETVEFAPPLLSAGDSPTAVERIRQLLAEADAFMASRDYPAARERFQHILRDLSPNHPSALYGMAILASLAEDRDQAKHYFLRALQRAREPHILGWAHVYLGRIYDLEGARQQALTHYRAALALDTRLEKVEEAARRGLERPFGGGE